MPLRARVITCSDAASRGERTDLTGPAVRQLLIAEGYTVDAVRIVPDEIDAIASEIVAAAEVGVRLIVTNGGTGIAPRDVTPEATHHVAERIIPGFGEMMRAASLKSTPMAPLSRAQVATRGSALIVNLPGSVNGAVENLSAIIHLFPHALELLSGTRIDIHPQGKR